MSIQSVTIPANGAVPISTEGRYLTVFSATHPFQVVARELAETTVRPPELVDLEGVQEVVFKNPEAAPLTVSYRVSGMKTRSMVDTITLDPNATVQIATGSAVDLVATAKVAPRSSATVNGLAQLAFTAAGSGSIPAGTRRKIIIQADAANAAAVWIGASAAGAGLLLGAGQMLEIDTAAAIPVYAEGAATLNLLEVGE